MFMSPEAERYLHDKEKNVDFSKVFQYFKCSD